MAEEKHGQRFRGWCFTLNNYTDAEQKDLRALGDDARTTYLVFGRETGEQGTPHLQGYVHFSSGVSLQTAKRRISGRAHLEAARGRPEEAAGYCKKDGDFEEYGVCPVAGKRNDLHSAREAVKAGKSLRSAVDEGDVRSFQALKGWDRLKQVYNDGRPQAKPELILCIGPSGSGKSKWAKEYLISKVPPGSDEPPWSTPLQPPQWWDGVDTCDRVLLDDLRIESRAGFSYLLRMFDDMHSVRLPVKGSSVLWTGKYCVITCVDLSDVVPGGEATKQLVRRCDKILEFDSNYNYADKKDYFVRFYN